MNVAGIIAEYNPFHNGHAYHIQKVREKTEASYIIALISGDFVQRGAPACADKYVRAQMALAGGADLVVELPVCAAVSSAETFARTGVSLLAHSGVVTHLGFGCESDDPAQLLALSALFAEEPAAFQELLSTELKKGKSFPAARAAAAGICLDDPTVTSVLESPNNILAIEYLKAIRQLQAPLTPCMILRQGSAYHDRELASTYSSATAIRELLSASNSSNASLNLLSQNSDSVSGVQHSDIVSSGNQLTDISSQQQPGHVPAQIYDHLKDQIPDAACAPLLHWLKQYGCVTPDDFSALLHYKLLQDFSPLSSGLQNISNLSDHPVLTVENSSTGGQQKTSATRSDLDHRTGKLLEQYISFSQFTELLKTRDRTYTAVSRYLLSHLLDISTSRQHALQKLDYAPYLRILGMKRQAAPLLKSLQQNSSVPILTRLAADGKKLNPPQQLLLHTDIQAAHIYNSILTAKTGICPKNEYRHPLIYC